MPTRLLVIGLDAMDPSLIEHGVESGDLPALARLEREGTRYRLSNAMRSLPGAIWPEICTGRSVGSVGLFFHPHQLHTGESLPREVEAHEVDPTLDWWDVAGHAGRRVLVLDVPQTVPRPRTNVVHIADWGNHDRSWSPTSEPPAALDDARALVGDHPISQCDELVRGGELSAYVSLLDGLLDGIDRRTRLAEVLLGREHWDAAMVAFTESHCAGHQLWVFADPTHPVALPERPERLRGAIPEVYRAIDAGIGRLVAAAGPDTQVLVVASHGMGAYVGGYQLVPEVLVRLGLRPRPHAGAAMLSRLPRSVRNWLRRVVPTRLRAHRNVLAGTLANHDLLSPRTKATAMPNNRCGAIRLNLRGREPKGRVEPGPEADAILSELRRELTALTQPGSGEPIVELVATATELYGDAHHPDLPDLTVAFRTDLGRLEACESPRVGLVEMPLWPRARRPNGWPKQLGRTGDHTVESRLWARAPGAVPGEQGTASVLDVAPTVLALLGVDIPEGIDGHAIVPTAP